MLSIIEQGLIFSLVAMAVFITSRVINRDDLSVEGSFGLGGAITATLLSSNIHPLLAVFGALLSGLLAGAFTGIFYTRLGLNHLMAGLVTTTGCFSLSLAIGGANKLVGANNIFTLLGSELLTLFAIALFVLLALVMLLRSQIGLILKVSGENPKLLIHFSKSSKNYQMFGFCLANAITALAGSLFVQWSGFFSITGTVGVLVTGLTSLMFMELFSKNLSLLIIASGIAYQSIFSLTLSFGIAPVWNNLVKAGLIVLLVTISKNMVQRKNHA